MADGQTEIDLSWTAPSSNGGASIDGYKIEVSTNGTSWSDLVADTGSSSTSYSHTGLTAGSTRHYRVSANNSAGTGAVSNVANTTTDSPPAATAPGAPTGLTATADGQTEIDLSWTAPSNNGGSAITAYDLRHIRSDAASKADASWTVLQDVWTSSGALSYDLTGLDGGTEYDVQVRAVNAAGDGPWSVTVTRATLVGVAQPASPANAQYRRDGATAIVSWDSSTGATSYKIYHSDSRFSPRCSLFSSGRTSGCDLLAEDVAGTSYTHTSPSDDNNYYWITACNSAGCSAIDSDNPAQFVDNRPTSPANAQYRREGATAIVSWDPSAGATSYKIYHDDFFGSNCRLSSGRPSFCDLLAEDVVGTSYTHASPDQDTNYYWITACNSAGCSAIDSGNPASMKGQGPAPDPVVDTPTVSESAPAAGASFTLSAAVRNRGSGSSLSTTLRYYRSTDSTITTGDTEVGTDPVGGLSASGTSAESISLTAPSTPGTYYYGACVVAVSGEVRHDEQLLRFRNGDRRRGFRARPGCGHSHGERQRSNSWSVLHTERHRAQSGRRSFGLDHAALLPVQRLKDYHR